MYTLNTWMIIYFLQRQVAEWYFQGSDLHSFDKYHVNTTWMIKNGGPRTTVRLRNLAKNSLVLVVNVPFTFTKSGMVLGWWYIQEDCFACWMSEPSTVCDSKIHGFFRWPCRLRSHFSRHASVRMPQSWRGWKGNFNGMFGNASFNGDVDVHHFKVSISFCCWWICQPKLFKARW